MKPIILIPGITATSLVNSNSFNYESVWNGVETWGRAIGSAFGRRINSPLLFDPDFDLEMESIVKPTVLSSVAYAQMYDSLSEKFSQDPIFFFPYDWRKSNMVNGKVLYDFCDYIKRKIEASNESENTSTEFKFEGFRFVTHSMGGLLFTCYLNEKLKRKDSFDDIDRAVLCTPPFRGSIAILDLMITGEEGLFSGFFNPDENQRKVRKSLRTYPSSFELLPWFEHAISFKGSSEMVDLTKIEHWQNNVYLNIERLFNSRLKELKKFRKISLDKIPTELKNRMLILVGENCDTYEKVYVEKERIVSNQLTRNFVLLNDLPTHTSKYGDGTVHLDSSTVYKNTINTICVRRPRRLDLQNYSSRISFHGLFLRDSRVENVIKRFLDGEHELEMLKSRDDDVRIIART